MIFAFRVKMFFCISYGKILYTHLWNWIRLKKKYLCSFTHSVFLFILCRRGRLYWWCFSLTFPCLGLATSLSLYFWIQSLFCLRCMCQTLKMYLELLVSCCGFLLLSLRSSELHWATVFQSCSDWSLSVSYRFNHINMFAFCVSWTVLS